MKRTEKIKADYKKIFNINYDLCTTDEIQIREESEDLCELVYNFFKLGYIKGYRSAIAKQKKKAQSAMQEISKY